MLLGLSRSCSTVACCAGLALVLVGCGGPKLVPVTGTVMLDGKPLTGAAGAVTFAPVGGGPSSAGSIKLDGTFSLTTGALPGVPAGEYRVGVTAAEPVKIGGSRDHEEIPKQLVAPRFADPTKSGLTFPIAAGQKPIEIPVSAK